MMEEEAVVTAVDGAKVWVEKPRKNACSSCAEKCVSGVTSGLFGQSPIRFCVSSSEALMPGDRVVVGLPEGAVVQGSFGIYLVPLLVLFCGALSGKFLAELSGVLSSDAGSAIGGSGALILCLLAFKWSNAFDKSAFRPVFLRKVH
jgi:sigma-E factor negative regulatory protein RseC